MRETFRRHEVGDRLSAAEVNRWTRVARRIAAARNGSNQYGQQTASMLGASGQPPFFQGVVEVVGQYLDQKGIYEIYPRYFDRDLNQWRTDQSSGTWLLDANSLELSLSAQDKLVAFWDDQREMFIPLGSGGATFTAPPIVDIQGGDGQNVIGTNQGNPDIEFALEKSDTGSGGWSTVNNRIYACNGNFVTSLTAQDLADLTPFFDGQNLVGTGHDGQVSGTGIYSYTAFRGTHYLRIVTASRKSDVTMKFAALRLTAAAPEGTDNSVSPTDAISIGDFTTVYHLAIKAEVNNDGPVVFSVDDSGEMIKVEVSADRYTILAELSCHYEVAAPEDE